MKQDFNSSSIESVTAWKEEMECLLIYLHLQVYEYFEELLIYPIQEFYQFCLWQGGGGSGLEGSFNARVMPDNSG